MRFHCTNCGRRKDEKPKSFGEKKLLCATCYQSFYDNNLKILRETSFLQNVYIPPANFVQVRTLGYTESHCCVCKSDSHRHNIPKQAISAAWVKLKLLIPSKNKTCLNHLDNFGHFNNESLDSLNFESYLITVSEADLLKELNTFLENEVLSEKKFCSQEIKYGVNFDNLNMSDSDYIVFTGLSVASFNHLLGFLSPNVQNGSKRNIRNALAIFLMKLRMNNSFLQIGTLFGISKQCASDTFDAVMRALEANFVPKFLDYAHISRQDFIANHQTLLSTEILGRGKDSALIIADGTYLRIQSSSNFDFQKKTYSMHKHYNLLKPMFIVAPDGYILAIEGLFYANGDNNDSAIFNFMMENSYGFKNFFHENDIFVLDRGFRDSVEMAELAGFEVSMPCIRNLRGGQQWTTQEANDSRKVTKIRWVVESVNGRLKGIFKFFRDQIQNTYIPKLGTLVRIACAIFNAYFPRIYHDKPQDIQLAQWINTRAEMSNTLQIFLQSNGLLNSRVNWIEFGPAEEFIDFPLLTMQDLREITAGIYQIKLANSYINHHMNKDEVRVFYHRENLELIRIKICSRFRANLEHKIWINYRPFGGDGPNDIKAYYCTCRVGARTIGTCSHVAAILWFLGLRCGEIPSPHRFDHNNIFSAK